ncbi:helix-turn-helix domain-containing protein [Microterricola gilva]|uniref:helix-turn-helix domain-containing protein n=1 Tax=Microterricola gilva TaxID=393267 RepID=UPI001A92059B
MVNMTVAPTMPLGERLSWGRKMAGIDQTEMGRRVGASRPTISLWERGEREPSFSQVVIWAREIGQPLEWLAEGVNAKTAPAEAGTVSGLVHPLGLEPRTH